MTTQRGRDLLLKIGDGGSPESFASVAGLRARTLAFNSTNIDVTNADSGGWRELMADGVQSAAISGSGVFKDAASDEALRAAFFAGTAPNWQVVIPGFGTVAGPFRITSLQYDGPHDGEVKIALSLASAGSLTFAAL
jgi:TP901-1 family phage major tail protein